MAKAYKCDCCEAFFDTGGSILYGSIVGGMLRQGWYPGEIELCPKCAEEIQKAIVDIWRALSRVKE